MRNTRMKNEVSIEKLDPQPPQKKVDDVEVIAKAVAIAMKAVMMPMFEKLMHQKALPEPVKEDCYSLVAYCAVSGIEVNRSHLALHGKELRKMANVSGLEIKKIPDERWGVVNSYPVGLLEEYFSA